MGETPSPRTPAPRSPVPRTASARRGLLLVATAALLVTPVVGQQPEPPPAPAPSPRSLLPEAFRQSDEGQTEAAPLPGVAPPPPVGAAAPEVLSGDALLQPPLDGVELPGTAEAPDPFANDPVLDARMTGVLDTASGGWGNAVFAGSDARCLAALARRIDAPVASRWASIGLRRAPITRATAPSRTPAGAWVAARAWLLLGMGGIVSASLLIGRLPVEAHTSNTTRIAGQVALAAGDLGALCPIARAGRQASADTMWELAMGMCAALEGDDISAAALFDSLRNRQTGISAFDVRLGERIAVVAGGGGRATNIEWSEAPRITPYRYGVSMAAGVQVPADRLTSLGAGRHGWFVRQPALAPAVRLASLGPAAVQGSLSVQEFVSGIAALAPDDADTSRGARLRQAFAGAGPVQRVAAMKAIWDESAEGMTIEAARYAGLLQTAPAAARLPVSASVAADSADIIASLLAAGNTARARSWWRVASEADAPVRARAWALLAVSGGIAPTADAFSDWQDATNADDRSAARLLAALAGLGLARESGWNGLKDDLLPKAETSWSRAISAAGTARRPGEVAILTATGLQGAWADVPALHLWRITEALTRAGRVQDARLIAAEALTRA
ncbi:hypothetical protein [Polymorphobacter multimanifer]|uniref:hypothetical protein n=1 Tax=Polymorphobacter multimanifer TaxID=1070431 RepID=UPI00166651BC|nr:hypothetical protein [Polymorphobacter multimanifer]